MWMGWRRPRYNNWPSSPNRVKTALKMQMHMRTWAIWNWMLQVSNRSRARLSKWLIILTATSKIKEKKRKLSKDETVSWSNLQQGQSRLQAPSKMAISEPRGRGESKRQRMLQVPSWPQRLDQSLWWNPERGLWSPSRSWDERTTLNHNQKSRHRKEQKNRS